MKFFAIRQLDKRWLPGLLLIYLSATLLSSEVRAQQPRNAWPQRVLITNDNGIDDKRTIELARAFARVAETYVVAANVDRSGGTNFLPATRSGRFRVERRDLGPGITAYALDGYPADCVVFALTGPLRDRWPDLVVSGINGGPNLADEWFGSGTIGAARTASYLGVPAIAVSGLDDDDAVAVQAAVSWVVKLAQSEPVRRLRSPQYLTVSLPVIPADQITGIKIVQRARGLINATSTRLPPVAGAGNTEEWELKMSVGPPTQKQESDVSVVTDRKIAIVAMRVDEHDDQLARTLTEPGGQLPPWPRVPATVAASASKCSAGLGIKVDDAEDERGHEWGAVIEAFLPGGQAEKLGLQVGDVIVALNGIDLSRPLPGDAPNEDPDDRFIKLLKQLACNTIVRIEYVRGGIRRTVEFQLTEQK